MECRRTDTYDTVIDMKILMFGWEFPPSISGGLGMACYGIVQGLLRQSKIDIHLVLPTLENHFTSNPHLHMLHSFSRAEFSRSFKTSTISTALRPYLTSNSYNTLHRDILSNSLYGKNLFSEIYRYADASSPLANTVEYDLIHAHDWLTILAAIKAKTLKNKPLIFHVHALECDRSPGHENSAIEAIEKYGLEMADTIITVSDYTKKNIVQHYSISPEKIIVIYNGIFSENKIDRVDFAATPHSIHTVLFLGRVTEQKGPYYFLKAAEKILKIRKDVEFIIAGDGDQLTSMIEMVARMGISHHIHFTGFLDRDHVERIFQKSVVYVMPSVSEPFGISCLEAVSYNVPVIISKQSGITEILKNSFTVDYWDVDLLASHILALLEYPAIKKEMVPHAKKELTKFTWDYAAKNIMQVYDRILLPA